MTEIRPLRSYAEVVLGRQRSPQYDQGPHMIAYLRAANVKDGRLDLEDVKEMNFSPSEQRLFGLRYGDVLVTEGSGSLSSVGASATWRAEIAGPICFQNTLLRLRPRQGTDSRFLGWWCRHAFNDGTFASVATGANIYHLSAERLGSLPLVYASLVKQRAIADYLDTETARIEALLHKKARLQNLLLERRARVARDVFTHRHGLRLKHLLAAPLAYGVLVPQHDIDGVPMLRITDLRTGAVDLQSVARIPATQSSEYRRTVLKERDLVVSVVGTLGRSLEVSSDLAGSNLNRALARVQLNSEVPRSLLKFWFETDEFQLQARLATASDSAQPTLGLGDMKEFSVGLPADVTRWSEIESKLQARVEPIMLALRSLQIQEDLLRERRQALITAAVTGELEVPGGA